MEPRITNVAQYTSFGASVAGTGSATFTAWVLKWARLGLYVTAK